MSSAQRAKERTQLFANARPYAGAQQYAPVTAARGQERPRSRYPESPFQYGDAANDHAEAQNDQLVEAISSKISVLKDLSLNIGKEASNTNGVLSTLGEQFDSARTSVKGTVKRLVKTADESGVGWRQWLLFAGFVVFCFWVVMII